MDVKTIAIAVPVGLAVIFATLFVGRWVKPSSTPAASSAVVWEPQSRSAGNVMIEVTPLVLAVGKPAKFSVSFNTHQGSLDFDVAKVATLSDSAGNVLNEATWEGSPPGGHHRTGTLTFTKNLANQGKVTLVISEVFEKEGVEFNWVVKK